MRLRTLALAAVLSSALPSQSPVLLRDINANPTGVAASSEPGALRSVGSHVYFAATASATGRELYRTTGVPGSTQLVADIRPGAGGSSPAGFVPLGALTLFAADDGNAGVELWRTDGTAAGTALVRDLAPGSASSRPTLLTPFGNAVYFATATDELWRSDGTDAGTFRVAAGVATVSLAVHANALWLLVSRRPPNTAVELWQSDGTPPGTLLAVSLPSEVTTQPMLATLGALFFITNSGVYRSDGTPAGTTLLVPATIAHGLTAAAGKLFFAARVQSTGLYELWVSDGTPTGTNVLSTSGATPSLLVADGGRLFFVTNSGVGSPALWITDGTVPGTSRIGDVPGSRLAAGDGAAVRGLSVGGRIVFESVSIATNTATIKHWVSDGTTVGTEPLPVATRFLLVSDLADRDRFALFANRGVCGFAAYTQQAGVELWRSDGTVAGTALVDDIDAQIPTVDSFPAEFTQVGAQTYFSASGSANGGNVDVELWRTDGTPAGTRLVADIEPGPTGSAPSNFAGMGGMLYFAATTSASGRELWRSDGTAAGTTLVKDIVPGSSGVGGPLNLQALDEHTLLFAGYQAATGYEPWVSDGTAAGTRLLLEIRPGTLGGNPHSFQVAGRSAFFIADDGVHGEELWVTDGTAAGTHLVIDLVGGLNLVRPSTTFGDRLLFSVSSGGGGLDAGLWITDGSSAGTIQLIRRPVGRPTVLGDLVYFSALDPATGQEPWVTDGTVAGTRLLLDIEPGQAGSQPSRFFALEDRVVFATNGGRIWRTQGTAASTQPVFTAPGTNFLETVPESTVVGSRWVWLVGNTSGVRSLWRTDGSTAGTMRTADSFTLCGPLATAHGRLLFCVHDPVRGREPFTVDVGATARPYGFGCATGLRSPRLSGTDPVLGAQVRLRGSELSQAVAAIALIGVPFATPLFVPGEPCAVYTGVSGPAVALPATVRAGTFDVFLTVPATPSLAGVRVATQAVAYPGQTLLGVDFTNAVELLLGR